jgi:hypothetical protein
VGLLLLLSAAFLFIEDNPQEVELSNFSEQYQNEPLNH